MTDYQEVRVVDVVGRVVTVDVLERAEGRAFDAIIVDGAIRPDAEDLAIKIAAELVLDGKRGRVFPNEDGSIPEPNHYVSAVRVLSAGPPAATDEERRAVLEVTMTSQEYAGLFEVGEEFGAVADPYGDFDDLFR